MANFLNVSKLKSDHLDCILDNSEGEFKRRPHSAPLDIFTADMNRTIDAAIKNVTHILETRNGDIREVKC